MDEQVFDIRAVLGMLRRQRRIIGLTLLVAMAGAVFLIFSLQPAYTATTLVLVDPSHKDLLSTTDSTANSLNDSPRVDSEVELVKSQETLLSVIKSENLVADPHFGPQLGLLEKLRVAFRLGDPPLPTGEDALRDVLDRLDKAVTVQREGETFLIDISAQTPTPALAAEIANAVAKTYIGDQRQAKVDSILASRDIIQSRLADANASVSSSEEAIDSFIEDNLDEIARSTGRSDLSGIRDQLQQLQTSATSLSARADALAAGLGAADWTKVAASLQSDAVNALETQREALESTIAGIQDQPQKVTDLRTELANLETKIRDQAGTGLTSLKTQIAASQSQSNDLKTKLRQAVVSSDLPPATLTNLYELQQNSQIARSQYQALIARQKDLETQAYLQVADSRIVSEALPPTQPSSPNTRLILILGALAGLALGVGLALLRENFIGGFTSEGQVSSVLKPSMTSSIGWQRQSKDREGKRVSLADLMVTAPLSIYAELIRRVQVGVDQALRRRRRQEPPQAEDHGSVVMVSSSGAGEGKTTLALALARAFTASGRSTLLIDCDLRAPRVHQHLKLEASAGLIDYLRSVDGVTGIEDISVRDPETGMQAIVGLHRSESPTDSLITDRSLSALLGAARRHFDIVVVDTPPIGPVVDGLYLAEHADVVVFVLLWVKTRQQNARAALAALRASTRDKTEILAVVNQERGGERPSRADQAYYYNY